MKSMVGKYGRIIRRSFLTGFANPVNFQIVIISSLRHSIIRQSIYLQIVEDKTVGFEGYPADGEFK